MIFKTFDSDFDNISSKWGMFGKSFSDISNTISTKWKQVNDYIAVTNDATISGIANAWKGSNPLEVLETSQVESILKNYNKALDQGAEKTADFINVGTGNEFTDGFLKDLNGAPATMDKYNTAVKSAENAQKGLTASMIASKVAAIAMNVAISMGVSIAISALVKVVDNLVHANEKAIESAEELRKKYEDFKETNASNVSILQDLKAEFDTLSKGVSQYGDNISLTIDEYTRYKEIVQQIVGMSPSLSEGYSTENGYIADKNGLLERAIELQEQEYKNELRKITNLDNLKTSMSGYIAEYKESFNGGLVTDDGSAIATREFTNMQNAIYELFNTNNRSNFSSEDMVKQIMSSLGVEDVEKEIAKYYNEHGYFQSSDFWNDYADTIAENIQVIDDSLSADSVGLDSTVFDQNIQKVESCAQSYADMKDSISLANESIQADLGYIAEYVNGYSELTSTQQKFVSEFLNGYDISDITSTDYFGNLVYDEDKMATVKSQIFKFVEELSKDTTTKDVLENLYAPPTDDESVSEYVDRIKTAIEAIQTYCAENGIEIPISLGDISADTDDLAAKYENAIQSANKKFKGEDLTSFFEKNSINTQEEIDRWIGVANSCDTAAEAKKKYLETDIPDETPISFQYDKLEDIPQKLSEVESAYKTAQSALEEYNKNGYNSMSTIDSILSLEDEYINVLVDENGQLQLNAETMSQLAAIKIETAKAAIYQETCEELVRIKTLDTALAAQELALVNGTLTESAYETAKALYVEVTAMGGANALLADKLWSATTKKITLLDNQLANLNNGNYRLGVSVNADTKKAETDWKKFLDNELNLARANFDAGLTDFNTYMSKRKDILDKYLAQDKISYDDYWDYIKKGYEEQKKFYDSVLSAVTRRLDREINSNQDIIDGLEKQNDALEKQKDNYDKIVSAVLDTIDAKKEEMQSSIDALEKENNAIGKQVDEYDSVISAIQNVYEEKQDALKAEQDAIQERIDALRDENDEHKRAIELQKARYELERSMNQRSKMVYNGEQFVYMADSQEVKDNREKLADLELENTIASMEKEKEALQELIDELDHYKNMWTDIADAYQKAKDADIARNILGENYDEDILLNRIEDIEAFKDRYMEAQSKIDDNTSLIESYEEKAGYYDGLKKKWEELSSVHEININKQLASERFGAGWETLILEDRLAGFDEFKENYLSIQDKINDNTSMIESYNEKIGYYQKLKNEWSAVADVYEDSVNTQHAAMLLGQNWETDILSGRITTLNQFKNDYVKIQEAIAQADVDRYNKQVEAARNAKNQNYTGNASIGNGGNITGNYSGNISGGKDDSFDDVNHYRIVDSKTGKVYIDGIESRQTADQWIGRQEESGRYTGSILGRMKVEKYARGGVISGDSSGYLDWIAELCKEDHIVAVSNNERVLTPEQNKSFEKIVDTIPSLIANTYNPKMTSRFDISEFNQTQTSQPVSFTMGDIHLHNVQNVDGLAKAIQAHFPMAMMQRMSQK